MAVIPAAFPAEGRVFSGDRELRFLALSLEMVVHDMSPVGDRDVAGQLWDYATGEGPPPDDSPTFVTLRHGRLDLENPPFLLAEIRVDRNDEYALEFAFDSELELLIDPPVEGTIEGSLETVVETAEQMLAEIYRTKGRRLEMLDAGVVDTEAFAERR